MRTLAAWTKLVDFLRLVPATRETRKAGQAPAFREHPINLPKVRAGVAPMPAAHQIFATESREDT
jgi:hypothetical protein